MGQRLASLRCSEHPMLGTGNCPIEFTPDELENYTGGYKKPLGKGGYGVVYEGIIPRGDERNKKGPGLKIAVKVSRFMDQTIRDQFEAEKKHLPGVEHQNIIELVGHCETPEKLYLVYPFMPNKTVQGKLSELDWSKTIKILKGVARAIEKLHSHEPALIYRDLKSDNILLDKDFNPTLADFGTVTVEGECFDHGTRGFTDPIIMNKGPGTKPNDVYSFGVVMLQLLTRKKVLVGGEECSLHITESATREKERGGHVVNYILLARGCSQSAAKEITDLALECVRESIEQRPTIAQVLSRLSLLDGGRTRSSRIQPQPTDII